MARNTLNEIKNSLKNDFERFVSSALEILKMENPYVVNILAC